jgi:hypothetical protein
LTLATDKLNESTEKQTRLKILDGIDEAKKSIADIQDQIASTNYSGVGFWGGLFGTESADIEGEILKLKTKLHEGEITIEEFRSTLTSMGEQDIKFRKPALKVNELTNALKASELALSNYEDKLKALDNPQPLKPIANNKNKSSLFDGLDKLEFDSKSESIESLMAKVEQANSSVGRFESSLGGSLDSNSWIYGALEGFDSVGDKAGSFASSTKQLVENAFSGMTDSLVEFAKTGKLSFKDLTNSIISDMIRMQIQQTFTAPLSKAFSSALTSYFTGGTGAEASAGAGASTQASVLHVGGMPGATSMSRSVPASIFMNAPRFHTGRNLPWLRQNEVPAILKDDEMVLSGNTVRKLSQSRGSAVSPNINVTVHNNGNSQVRTETNEDTNGFNLDIIVEEIEGTIANNVSRNRGPLNDVLQQQFKHNGANY